MNPCSRPEWTHIHVPVQQEEFNYIDVDVLVYIIYILGS